MMLRIRTRSASISRSLCFLVILRTHICTRTRAKGLHFTISLLPCHSTHTHMHTNMCKRPPFHDLSASLSFYAHICTRTRAKGLHFTISLLPCHSTHTHMHTNACKRTQLKMHKSNIPFAKHSELPSIQLSMICTFTAQSNFYLHSLYSYNNSKNINSSSSSSRDNQLQL